MTISDSKLLVLDYGETITLTCTAVGASKIGWKQGEADPELKMCNMSKQSCQSVHSVESAMVTGVVSCVAQRGNTSFNDTITVQGTYLIFSCFLFYLSVVRSNATVEPKTAQLNSTTAINLTCAVAGYPLPNVSWILPNGTIIRGTGKKSNLSVSGADGGGIYRCRAESTLSNSTANATVEGE